MVGRRKYNMKISFTSEEITEIKKFVTMLGLDITAFGGLNDDKTTLFIKPAIVCQQIAIRRHEISNMGPIKIKAAKAHILNYIKENFAGSMMAK